MSDEFDNLTDDQQDEAARKKIRDLLSKPELTEEDVQTAAACVAFIGTSFKASDKFAQALIDTAESLTQGLCVRCGEEPGHGPPGCLICQGIRSVLTLKRIREEAVPEDSEALERGGEEIAKVDLGIHDMEEVEPARIPWTAEELDALSMNRSLSPKTLAKYIRKLSGRTPEELQAKLKELYG